MKDTNRHPFSNNSFYKLLEDSKSLGEGAGWIPKHFELNESKLPGFIKFHSYGEYIFDWSWAHFYDQNKIPYNPKLLHAIPFTHVNAPKFLGDKRDFPELAQKSFNFYQSHNLSGEHYLFINDEEEKLLSELGFKGLYTHQYHFKNEYESFEHFLDRLKKSKRKI